MSQPDFFLERVTSEIHQQMDGVLAMVSRLSRQTLNSSAAGCVAGIGEAANSVKQIISLNRDLAAASAGNLAFNPIPQPAREMMDALETRWSGRAAVSGVTLLVSYDGDPGIVANLDATRVLQAFDGLIAQAMAGARKGAVEASLKARQAGEVIRMEGRVRGGGERDLGDRALDIREIEAMFGLETALGAALGREILQILGGNVSTKSNRGGGETLIFQFEAPLVREATAPVEEANSGSSAHILVVDDNATNRMVAETLCGMFECTTEAVADGVEAVEAARSGRFDLILMDIKMPRMDGVTATREIRALAGRAGRVPIIALTANADPEDAEGYLRAGMNGVVEKPMKPENLLRALQDNLHADPDLEDQSAQAA